LIQLAIKWLFKFPLLPTYPIAHCVFNIIVILTLKNSPFFFVSATTKTQIADALLNVVNDDDEYKKRFAKYGVLGFERTNTAMYDCVRDVLHLTRNQTLYPTYY